MITLLNMILTNIYFSVVLYLKIKKTTNLELNSKGF